MGIVQTFIIIERCYTHIQRGDNLPIVDCRCFQRLYHSGPFGKAQFIGAEFIEWVFMSVEGNHGMNHVGGKPINEEQAVWLCAYGVLP